MSIINNEIDVETVSGVTNTHHRFVYDGYLCVQRLNGAANNSIYLVFGWDPSEPVATRPLVLQKYGQYNMFYTHDGNKNVSELVFFQQASGIAAHYEYAPFGSVTATGRSTSVTAYDFCEYNPFQFSSEYADDTLGLVYYNYRHYNQTGGRWNNRDCLLAPNEYLFVSNDSLLDFDQLGMKSAALRPWNRPLNIPVKPPHKPIIVIPEGPSIRSDGSLANAIADEMSRVYYSKERVLSEGINLCKRFAPPRIVQSSSQISYERASCKCCVVSYLLLMVDTDNSTVYHFYSASVHNQSCAEVKRQGFWDANHAPYKKIYEYIPWY